VHILKNRLLAGLAFGLVITSAGCSRSAHQYVVPPQATLAFTCVNQVDRLPPLDPLANSWFKQARDLQNASGEKDYNIIANFYRQAAEKNHYKAMINLQNLLYQGLAEPVSGKAAPEEVIALAEKMMKLNIPAGYYAMGHYLEVGYGVDRDKAASLAYFRKSADMGSPEGQYVVGKLLLTGRFEDPDNPDPYRVKFKPNPAYRPEIGTAMLSCAANQGHGEAADWLAGWLKAIKKDYKNAIIYYQLGVKAGNRLSALQLSDSFKGVSLDDRMAYLAVEKDIERSSRYELIYQEISNNPSARFPDIDKIVPLPPAPLPDWDGTFEYKKP
jgi:TPR repeat protein